MFDTAPCGLMQTDSAGGFRRVNATFAAWIGYTADELVGHFHFQDLLTTGGRIFHQTHWAPLLAMQGSVAEVKLEIVHRDGARVPMVVNARRDVVGGVVVHDLAAFIARDRDRYEKELIKSREQLRQLVAETQRLHSTAADRALFAEQMIGIVSHDLRNPLATVQMGTALLSSALSGPHKTVNERVARAADRAVQLIGDLLDFTQARVGAGILVVPVEIDLHEVTAEAIEELRLAHPTSELVHQRAGTGRCRADPHRLVQALGNLVSNAAAYGDPSRPVTVTSAVAAIHATLSVHNFGAVIPPELQPTLFTPMARGTAGGAARSVGLGLFIVREIAKAHGGVIHVASNPVEGTRFEIALPVEPGARSA